MYSMKRTITPVPRKRSTRSSTVWSLTPRWTTALTLMGARPARRACSMPCEHVVDAAEAAAHAREDLGIQAVETDRDALQARGLQLGGVLRQQHAVGGQRDILDAGDRGQVADQVGEIRAQQRLAAGQAQLAHARAARTGARAARFPRTTAARASPGSGSLSWKVSRGMQYGQRKLQRSMTEMRRSRIGRSSVSRGGAAH